GFSFLLGGKSFVLRTVKTRNHCLTFLPGIINTRFFSFPYYIIFFRFFHYYFSGNKIFSITLGKYSCSNSWIFAAISSEESFDEISVSNCAIIFPSSYFSFTK